MTLAAVEPSCGSSGTGGAERGAERGGAGRRPEEMFGALRQPGG